MKTYAMISPYSGIVITVMEHVDDEGRSSRDYQPVEPLVFRPQYAIPLAEGAPVPY